MPPSLEYRNKNINLNVFTILLKTKLVNIAVLYSNTFSIGIKIFIDLKKTKKKKKMFDLYNILEQQIQSKY